MNKKNNKKKNRKNAVLRFLFVIFLISMFAVIFTNVKTQKTEGNALQKQIDELQVQIDNEEKTHEELENKEAYMKTKSYVEDVARTKLGLVYPNEIVVRPEE